MPPKANKPYGDYSNALAHLWPHFPWWKYIGFIKKTKRVFMKDKPDLWHSKAFCRSIFTSLRFLPRQQHQHIHLEFRRSWILIFRCGSFNSFFLGRVWVPLTWQVESRDHWHSSEQEQLSVGLWTWDWSPAIRGRD